MTVACIAAVVVVAAAFLVIWSLCAVAADADDAEEQRLGIRRS